VLGSKPEIFLVGIVILSFFTFSVFADDSNSILLETDQQEYKIGDLMVISGVIEEKKMPVVALKIFDPNGGILSANQVDIEDDNTFYKTITLDSPFYDEKGIYSITMNYGQLETETIFEMVSDSNADSVSDDEYLFLIPEILAMFTDKEIYDDGDTLTILGLVSEKDAPSVLIGIYDPFGTPAGFYFADVDNDLEFTTSFLVKAGVNFKTEGFYSISAFYGDSEIITSFEYVEKIQTIEIPIIDDDTNNEQSSNDVDDSTSGSSSSDEKIIDEITKLPSPQAKNLDENKKTTTSTKNLSVEDIELGIMLNQINLRCDTSEYVDTISYYDSMGPALIRLCKYDEAIYYYDQSLIQEPNNVEILTNKGSALAKIGFYEEAIIHYDSALAVDPYYYLALNNKGNALANLGNYDKAILAYNKALDSSHSNSVVLTNLEKAKEKLVVLEEKSQESSNSIVLEQEDNLIRSSNQQETMSIFDQIGNIFSSLFSFLS